MGEAGGQGTLEVKVDKGARSRELIGVAGAVEGKEAGACTGDSIRDGKVVSEVGVGG